MTIVKNEFNAVCDMDGCMNEAAFIISAADDITMGNIKMCECCAKSLHKELGKIFIAEKKCNAK